MQNEIEIFGEKFLLLPERAVLWQKKKILLIADVHLGKAGYFRSRGIPIPQQVATSDLNKISSLTEKFSPGKIIFLGDFFHSTINYEWKIFEEWREKFSSLRLELVKGNHDIIKEKNFSDLGVLIHSEILEEENFLFTHKPLPEEKISFAKYSFCGHIHPGVQLRGGAHEKISLPCFYFGERQAILPAFGEFTGMAKIFPKPGEKVFVIADGEVFQIAVG